MLQPCYLQTPHNEEDQQNVQGYENVHGLTKNQEICSFEVVLTQVNFLQDHDLN